MENNPWHSRCCRSRSPWLTRLVVLLQTDPGRHLVGRLFDELKCYLCIGYTILRIGYLTSPTLVVFIWATRAHGPSPQPTEYMCPTYSLLSITASNQANAKISTYFAREVPNVFVILARLWWITYPTAVPFGWLATSIPIFGRWKCVKVMARLVYAVWIHWYIGNIHWDIVIWKSVYSSLLHLLSDG